MRRLSLRFSLLDALRAVMAVALCCTVLRHDLSLMASLGFMSTVGALCFGTVGAFWARDRHRIFWTGFAVFGWVYLVLAFYEWRDPYTDPATDWLLTSKLLYWFANRIAVRMDHWSDYWRIGHCVLTVVFAFVGATLTCRLFSRRSRKWGQEYENSEHISS